MPKHISTKDLPNLFIRSSLRNRAADGLDLVLGVCNRLDPVLRQTQEAQRPVYSGESAESGIEDQDVEVRGMRIEVFGQSNDGAEVGQVNLDGGEGDAETRVFWELGDEGEETGEGLCAFGGGTRGEDDVECVRFRVGLDEIGAQACYCRGTETAGKDVRDGVERRGVVCTCWLL